MRGRLLVRPASRNSRGNVYSVRLRCVFPTLMCMRRRCLVRRAFGLAAGCLFHPAWGLTFDYRHVFESELIEHARVFVFDRQATAHRHRGWVAGGMRYAIASHAV